MKLRNAIFVSLLPLLSAGLCINCDQPLEPQVLKLGRSTSQRTSNTMVKALEQHPSSATKVKRYNTISWNGAAEAFLKDHPHDRKAAEAAAEAGIKHGEQNNGWSLTNDYAIRSPIHGPDPDKPDQLNYFPGNPQQKWVTVQGTRAGGKTEAHHIPVNAQGIHDPSVQTYTVGDNWNKGKTQVPGNGSPIGRITVAFKKPELNHELEPKHKPEPKQQINEKQNEKKAKQQAKKGKLHSKVKQQPKKGKQQPKAKQQSKKAKQQSKKAKQQSEKAKQQPKAKKQPKAKYQPKVKKQPKAKQ